MNTASDHNLNTELFTLSDGEIELCLVGTSSLHLRSVTPEGDPVELSDHEAELLSEALLRMIKRIK